MIPLVDLRSTYFTVEDIKTKYDRLFRNRNDKSIYKEELSELDKFRETEKEKLKNIVEIVQEQFKENNNRTYASCELSNPLNTNSIIEIHLKKL